jgi:hypothetical protein
MALSDSASVSTSTLQIPMRHSSRLKNYGRSEDEALKLWRVTFLG